MAETKEKSTGGANKNAGSVSDVTESVKTGSNKAAENVKSGAGKPGGNNRLFARRIWRGWSRRSSSTIICG